MTAHGNIGDGVQSIKNGAFDYIVKSDDNNKILSIVSRAISEIKKRAEQEPKQTELYTFDRIIRQSERLKAVVAVASKVAETDVLVLLTGETGTGKEVFAQSIHSASKRRGNFVAVNCSAFNKDLLESELFGHKSGSFTGVTKDKKGLFEEANHGTLFLCKVFFLLVVLFITDRFSVVIRNSSFIISNTYQAGILVPRNRFYAHAHAHAHARGGVWGGDVLDL